MSRSRIQEDGTIKRILYKPDEEKIMAAFMDMVAIGENDSEEEKSEKRHRLETYQAFAELVLRGTSLIRRLSYDVMPQFLMATGLTYRDILEIANGENGQRAQLSWSSEIEEAMCAVCDSLPAEIREKIHDMIIEIMPGPLMDVLFSDDTEDMRIFDMAEIREKSASEAWSKIKDDPMLKNMCVYRHIPDRSINFLPFSKYSKVVQDLDVSYHWILNLDETVCILAKNGDTEMIMDAFCVLPDHWKKVVYSGAKLCLDRLNG